MEPGPTPMTCGPQAPTCDARGWLTATLGPHRPRVPSHLSLVRPREQLHKLGRGTRDTEPYK